MAQINDTLMKEMATKNRLVQTFQTVDTVKVRNATASQVHMLNMLRFTKQPFNTTYKL